MILVDDVSIVMPRKIQSHHRTLFIPKEMGNSNKNPKIMVFITKSGFGSRLCKEKVLAPLIYIVLNGNHYACSSCVRMLLSEGYLVLVNGERNKF